MSKTAEQIWEGCINIIKDNINEKAFETWFKPIKPVSLKDNILTIQVPSQFYYEWLEEHYIDLLRKVISRELGKSGRLEYSIIMERSHPAGNDDFSIKMPGHSHSPLKKDSIAMPLTIASDHSGEIPNPFVIPGLRRINVDSNLIESYSFDNFVEGEHNRLARSAGMAVGLNPGKTSFNPLLIYSEVGLGKTHLAQAIGLEVKANFPEKTVLYVSTEQFTQQYIDAVKSNNYNDFVHFYQMIDVLIMDDIQFLTGKEKTQNVFFHIFNHMYQGGKQIILTSDKSPIDIQYIEPRLLSRFKWGLSAELQQPDYETRIAILKKRLYNDGIEMPQAVIEYVAYHINTNVRELEGAYINIMAQSSLNKKEITLELVEKMIEKYVRFRKHEVSFDHIMKKVCQYFRITPEQILSKTRKREIVQARQLLMYFTKKLMNLSLSSIGAQCGKKDHATVLHACKTVNNLMDTDSKYYEMVKDIERKING